MSTPTQMAQARSLGQIAHELETRVRGPVHLPGEDGYERQRDGYGGAPEAQVKTAYDPGNLFHRNHNIPPL